MARVHVLTLLTQLQPEVHVEHRAFAHALLTRLMEHQRHLVAESSYKNFPNSLSHRQKHRGITAILLLLPFVDEVTSLLAARMCVEPQHFSLSKAQCAPPEPISKCLPSCPPFLPPPQVC